MIDLTKILKYMYVLSFCIPGAWMIIRAINRKEYVYVILSIIATAIAMCFAYYTVFMYQP